MTFRQIAAIAPGHHTWADDQHTFDLRIIRDEVASHSGLEVYHMYAAEAGQKEDAHGHHVTIQPEGEDVDMHDHLMEQVQRYLEIRARASRATASRARLGDLFVSSRDVPAARAPANLTHLNQ